LAACFALLLTVQCAVAGPLDGQSRPDLRRLYRFRRSGAMRAYTSSLDERLLLLIRGLVPDGVLGQVRVSAAPGTVPLYSITLAGGDVVLTYSEAEAVDLRSQVSVNDNGVVGYVYTDPPVGIPNVPLYRMYSRGTQAHVYTTDPTERDRLLIQGYFLQQSFGPYVYLVQDLSTTRPLFIAPIHEHAYTDGRTLEELRRMKRLLAPDGGGPSVRLGWAKSYWYLTDSGNGPALSDILELARTAPIPLVLILNGGRWMCEDENAAELDTLRRLGESVPLYQLTWLWNKQSAKHLYTIRPEERAMVGTYERIVAGVYRSRVDGTVPLYRLFFGKNGDHLFTVDESERSAALEQGAVEEAIAAYVFPSATDDTVPLYRLANRTAGDHFYTTDAAERAALLGSGAFVDEGIACHVHPFPLTTLTQSDLPLYRYIPGKQFVSLSRLNAPHYRWKREALVRAGQRLKAWAQENPELLVGVTIDPETLLNDEPGLGFADYNPIVIEEWHQWLANSGIYDPVSGAYRGKGRKPSIALEELAAQLGRPYRSWADVLPPRSSDGTRLWQLWRDWCRQMVQNHNQDMADWLVEGGIPREMIFAHQTPNIDPERFGDTPDSAILRSPEGVSITGGITAFGGHARQYDLFANLVSRGIRYWGLFEYNPTELSATVPVSYDAAMDSLLGLSASDVSIIAPYKWPVDEQLPGARIEGTPFQAVLADFIRRYGSVLR
jgi:hypothetical protein